VVSTGCAVRRCSARHALAGVAIATMTSLRHPPTTDSHDGRALAEVCTVPVLLAESVSSERRRLPVMERGRGFNAQP